MNFRLAVLPRLSLIRTSRFSEVEFPRTRNRVSSPVSAAVFATERRVRIQWLAASASDANS